MSDTTMREYLAEHPKMTGALFTLLLLLSQAGTAAAANNSSYIGP
ncbi:DUF7503 family protein [Haloarcula rubripromontorii]